MTSTSTTATPPRSGRETEEIVTSIISHEILPEAVAQYEQWLTDIRKVSERFAGYLSTDVIRPLGKQHTYVVIIRFDGFDNLNRWMQSTERHDFIARMQPFLPQGDRYQIRTGLEFWFTPPGVKHPTPWKQFLITWSAIFPLSTLVPFVIAPIFAKFSPFPGEFIAVRLVGSALIVLMMVYVVMPRYTKWVSSWLFR